MNIRHGEKTIEGSVILNREYYPEIKEGDLFTFKQTDDDGKEIVWQGIKPEITEDAIIFTLLDKAQQNGD